MKWKEFIEDYLLEKELSEAEKNVGEHPRSVGFHAACIRKMKGKVGDPEAYCAAIKDRAWKSSFWRGKGKTKKQAAKDTAEHPNK